MAVRDGRRTGDVAPVDLRGRGRGSLDASRRRGHRDGGRFLRRTMQPASRR
jgi:hypothetical protein